MNFKIFFLIIPAFLIAGICFSQKTDLSDIQKYIEKEDWVNADSLCNSYSNFELSESQKSKINFYKGVILFNNDLYDKGFEYLSKSKKYYEKNKNKKDLAITISQIIECINYLNNEKANQLEYINSFCNLSNELNDYNLKIDCEYFKGTYAFDSNKVDEGINHYRKASKIALENNDSLKYYNNLVNEGVYIGYYEGLPKKAIELYNKIIPIFISNGDRNREYSSMYNLSIQYYLLNDIEEAIRILHDADNIKLKSDRLDSKAELYYQLSAYYQVKEDYKASLKYLELSNEKKDSIRKDKQQTKVRIIEEELDNEKLRADNLEQETKNLAQKSKTKQITIALTSTLLLGSIIAFLVYRNTKRKQRIAEQDRELQIQKTETILKEKELETINAMVSGQEKERLRLAGELHDNLGSTLATVRMQVENLERNLDKVDDPKALLQKTNALVNEAYDKVRSISHQRNSGVMAKDGLLPAVQKLARTVSSNNSLQVAVQDFGLENRIPNELEITMFRIIQELVTNIIKHAQATEASISLTQHHNELNIMVEDNGKGFKVGKLEEKDGMGLGNIERRIEHLEGTMEVDSMLGRGTSISIDIPLQ
jgi:two-component system sensor histidine kinase DegS